MSKAAILVVEDDAAIMRGVVDALQFAGFQTLEAADGNTGLEMAVRREYDLLLLDLVLPGIDGLDILREVKRSRATLPVIILTARGREADRVEGLRSGADDYVVKPFSVKELLARIDAVLRRSPERPSDVTELAFPGGCARLESLEVLFDDGRRSRLTEREAQLLRYLAASRGRTVSREEILARVWRISPRGVQTRTIDMHVARLRAKLQCTDGSENPIRTVRGAGYMFQAPEEIQ